MTSTAAPRRCRIEGLLEGPLPPVAGFSDYLVAWQARLLAAGIELRVSTEGGRFDVHAPQLDLGVPEVGRDPAESLASALDELVEQIPVGARARLHSTLRTTEYGGGTQRRTLYALRETGELVRVEDSTIGEPLPLDEGTQSQRFHWSFWVAIVLVALLLVLSGPRLVERFGLGPGPDAAAIATETAPGGYQLVAIEHSTEDTRVWSLLVHRAPDFAQWSEPHVDAAASDEMLLFRLATQRGRGEILWRDAAGVLLRVDQVDLAGLAELDEVRVPVAEPPHGASVARLSW